MWSDSQDRANGNASGSNKMFSVLLLSIAAQSILKSTFYTLVPSGWVIINAEAGARTVVAYDLQIRRLTSSWLVFNFFYEHTGTRRNFHQVSWNTRL